MSEMVQVSIRIPAATLERLDALVPHLAEDEELSFATASRNLAARVALARGLEVLEQRYNIKRVPRVRELAPEGKARKG